MTILRKTDTEIRIYLKHLNLLESQIGVSPTISGHKNALLWVLGERELEVKTTSKT